MIGGRKVVGLCLTMVHKRTRADLVNKIKAALLKYNIKLMVFNSVVDFYNNDVYDKGAKSVYGVINYDLVDALIILTDNFCNSSVWEEIADDARSKGVPVVLVDAEREGFCCITKEYREAYKEVIRHIICDHGCKDTFFIAGLKENDVNSQIRIQCYKEVLEENGLEFSAEDMLAYGDYWSGPAQEAVEQVVEKRGGVPQAFICANDYMAIAVCEKLQSMGYNVPEDVAVIGFDGVPDANYFHPRLTTCREDSDQLAQLCVDSILRAFDGKDISGVLHERYLPAVAHSCGCPVVPYSRETEASYLFYLMQGIESHETYMFSWLDMLVESTDLNELSGLLTRCVLPGSYICLKSNIITNSITTEISGGGALQLDKMVVIPHRTDKEVKMLSQISCGQIVPDLDKWAADDSAYVITSVFTSGQECGYYAIKTDDLMNCAHQLNRIAKVTNIALNSAINYLKQKFMRLRIENASLVNPITELPNLKGANKWFEEFSANEENHKKVITVSLYMLPKYKYIYENYGMQDIEETLCLVAETLKMANPENTYIAHVAENEFIVVNYYNGDKEIATVINNATSMFFTNIENYNNSSGKEYYIEVNCGCTVVDPGWKGTLSDYTKLASIELYASRIKNGMGDAVKENDSVADFYEVFNTLLERNLFLYYFQPIVNAKNGEIYAYEALMRTDSNIGMDPVQILKTAKSYKRLYEVEKATMFNVMERYASETEAFGGKKVFINSIPGYFLKADDMNELVGRYAGFMRFFVFEITEQDSISDEELDHIKSFGGKGSDTQIAIDDYGTGHSNIVNLLRYNPHIIKIDRFLIENIHRDVNKQMFVRNTIDFAKLNGVKTLAEGVETYDELRTVIDFGVDYIQGYYTGRPQPEPILEIDPEVRKEILDANPLMANAGK